MAKPERGAWLKPLFIAPPVVLFGLAVFVTCCTAAPFMTRLGAGATTLVLAPIAGLLYALFIGAVDIVLRVLRRRALPTGFSAWFSTAAATVAGVLLSGLVGFIAGAVSEETLAVLSVVTIVFSATCVRLAFGSRPR
jgi:hypothetical protein